MRKIFYIVVIPLLLLIGNISAFGQSNKGTEFWTAYMDHIAGAGNGGSSMALYITSDISTTVIVSIADGSFQPIANNVTANAVTIVPIPASAFLGNTNGTLNKGIHIISGKPVAVYAHIYAQNVSGATLLLPVNSMGKDYISLNYTQKSNNQPAYSVFNIVATEDNTNVLITPSAALIDGKPAGVSFPVTLQKGEVYQGLSATDLTGTKIQSTSTLNGSCKKIAVFSGSSKIGIGCANTLPTPSQNGPIYNFSSDNLFQQVYPTSTWGKNYVTAPLLSRPYDIYRIVLSTPNTNVTLNGAPVTLPLVNNLYYEFTSQTTNVISADKPIQVVQYSATQGQGLNCTNATGDIGDPEMIYLSPIEQGLDHVTLYSSGYFNIVQSYINVIIPTSAVSSFTLDGIFSTNFTPVANNTAYSYAQIKVTSGPKGTGVGGSFTSGTHTIKASAPFNAIAYGFGSPESYGYAAGTNLKDLTEYITLQNPQKPTDTITTGCSNIVYKPRITLPYKTSNISWNIDGNITSIDNTPVYSSIVPKGNDTLYVYDYNAGTVSLNAGTHKVIATVLNPIIVACGSYEDVENDFIITDPGASDFIVAASNCLGDSTAFKDATIFEAGDSGKTWLWDFGDNTTSTKQNPSHLYATAGDYIIHLTVTDINGCSTVSPAKTVHVIPKPVAAFTFTTPDCAGQNVTLTSTSTSTEGTINNWHWDYGDGTTLVDLTSGAPFTHVYATAGTYNVKLIVTTDLGCYSDTTSQTVTVHPTPLVDFILPDVCLADASALFINKSTIADNSVLTYLWNFGDQNSTAINNTSTLTNPQHKYSQQGVYTVTLTVTSQYGCITTKAQYFTVNGSIPQANFIVENSTTLCSSNDVIFDEKSTVNFGNITKVVWYFDYQNNPGITETYTTATMPADRKYHHNYGLFPAPPSQTYKARLDAYSGGICVSTIYKDIIVNANPVIALTVKGVPTTNPVVVCEGDAPMQIIQNKGVYNGTGVFSGTGVSANGLFDPKAAGPGTYTIGYLFTSAVTTCTYATTVQFIVNPTPVITLTPSLTLLQGGKVTLNAKASISSGTITYKWAPSEGLSQDDIPDPVASPIDDTQYTLTVISDKLCSAVAKVTVKVLKAPVVPNAFTPNGDNINDTWDIKYLDQYVNSTVEIFNRYGEKVFSSVGYPTPWDGRFKGANLPVGTYYYIINPKNGRKAMSGYVAIIR